jgi:putative membrane protein
MMWGMSGMMGLMVLAWVLVIGAIVAGVWWVLRNARPSRRHDALDILRERYARGEISREEYESRRRDLAA